MSQISDSKTDFIIIKPTMALFVFKIDEKKSWHWYQNNTPTGRSEYGWWAEFKLDNNQYTCGYRLFKHPFAEASSGSFKQLIQAGQIDLSSRKTISQKQISEGRAEVKVVSQRDNDAKVESLVKSNKLIIVLEEQQIIEQFRVARPDSILFHSQTAVDKFDRHKVGVTYTSK